MGAVVVVEENKKTNDPAKLRAKALFGYLLRINTRSAYYTHPV